MNEWNLHLDTLSLFSDRLVAALDILNIRTQCESLEIDHLCIRSRTSEEADRLSYDLDQIGSQISNLKIHGRPIKIYLLDTSIALGQWDVPCIEVPYPKPGSAYPLGWEHAEFVIPVTENTLDGVRDSVFDVFPHLNNDAIRERYGYYENPPPTDEDVIPNPTIVWNINGIGIKFHANAIKTIKEANV